MRDFLLKLKGAWRSRTVWYGLLLSTALYMQSAYQSFTPLVAFLPPAVQPLVPALLGLFVVVLRFLTTQPLDDK